MKESLAGVNYDLLGKMADEELEPDLGMEAIDTNILTAGFNDTDLNLLDSDKDLV